MVLLRRRDLSVEVERGEQAPGYAPTSDAGSDDRASSEHAEAKAADNTGARDGSSAHDAPLRTSESDPAAASPTGGQSERLDKGE